MHHLSSLRNITERYIYFNNLVILWSLPRPLAIIIPDISDCKLHLNCKVVMVGFDFRSLDYSSVFSVLSIKGADIILWLLPELCLFIDCYISQDHRYSRRRPFTPCLHQEKPFRLILLPFCDQQLDRCYSSLIVGALVEIYESYELAIDEVQEGWRVGG